MYDVSSRGLQLYRDRKYQENILMKLEIAENIRMDWGKFLETSHGVLLRLFFPKIPQGLLPYPRETIEEALDMQMKHFSSTGNQQAVESIKATLPFLWPFVDDKEALQEAAKRFSDDRFLAAVLPSLEKRQRQALTELEALSNELLIQISIEKAKLSKVFVKENKK